MNTAERSPRPTAVLIAWAVCAAVVFAGLFALGTWQVQRRAWKLDLIARVAQRAHRSGPTMAAPGPAQWPRVNAADDEYRRVHVTGAFLHDRETLVQASTRLGTGFWVLTPLRLADGTVVLVNRGFVPPQGRDRSARAAMGPRGQSTVTGLLRMTEPGAGFPRRNDASANRWFSRDIQAIAAARGLVRVAPYFVDADASAPPAPGDASGDRPAYAPIGCLTVVDFPNNHLVYAVTWYALALMVLGAAWQVWREERGRRRLRGENAGHADEERSNDDDGRPNR